MHYIQVVLKALDPSFEIHDPYNPSIQGLWFVKTFPFECFKNTQSNKDVKAALKNKCCLKACSASEVREV